MKRRKGTDLQHVSPCDLYPLTPHFYIVKLGFTGGPYKYRKAHIPESTFNYQKALRKYMQGDVFIARDYFIVHNG